MTHDCHCCGRYLKDGVCVSDCGDDSYQYTDKWDGHQSCQRCDPSCLSCNGGHSTNCTSCNENAVLSDGVCYPVCPVGYVWLIVYLLSREIIYNKLQVYHFSYVPNVVLSILSQGSMSVLLYHITLQRILEDGSQYWFRKRQWTIYCRSSVCKLLFCLSDLFWTALCWLSELPCRHGTQPW